MHDSSAFELIEERAEIRRSHRMLLRQGQNRFGPPDAQVEAALTAVRDLDRLERMADAVLNVSSWQDLIATS